MMHILHGPNHLGKADELSACHFSRQRGIVEVGSEIPLASTSGAVQTLTREICSSLSTALPPRPTVPVFYPAKLEPGG